jgi:hypothetical protein
MEISIPAASSKFERVEGVPVQEDLLGAEPAR